jgi:glycosyltransferase involved in cell wall biosynthesis
LTANGHPRVLFLTESFFPVLGGGETHIRELSRRLVESGIPATVLTRQGEVGWKRDDVLDGVRVLRVPPVGSARRGKYGMVPRAVARALRESQTWDLLVVRGTRVLGLPGLLLARLLGKPVVLQAEVNGEMSGEVYTWGTRLARLPWRAPVAAAVRLRNVLLRDADAFVAMSRRIRDEFLESGVPEGRVAYLPHGVDTRRFRPASPDEKVALRKALQLPVEAPIVVYTGRLLRGKGLEVLVSAFARVSAERPDVRLVLVGSGAGQMLSAEEELKAQAERLGLAGRVVFTGRVDNVEDFLRAADVFVFPSVFEALGLSLIEAAACGLPCVATRTGGIVDVVEQDRSGLLVEAGEAAGLGQALLRLLTDPAQRTAFGLRAREVASARFDVEGNVLGYRGLFQELYRRRAAL